MSRGVNKVILVGNLGADPDVRFTQNQKQVANLSIATSDSWTDQSGQRQERTEWHRVVFFGRLAEIVAQYLRKGSKIYVEGRLQTRKWQNQQGQDQYTTEIIANEMQMLDSRGGGPADQGNYAGNMGGGNYNQNFNQAPQGNNFGGQQQAAQQNWQQPAAQPAPAAAPQQTWQQPAAPAPQAASAPQAAPAPASAPAQPQPATMDDFGSFDDEIPF